MPAEAGALGIMQKAARRIVEKLRLHGHEAFFAGGWVRDFLLRRKPKDIDIATSALPDEVLRLFPDSTPIGAQFGVVQVRMYGHNFDVATFRSDDAYLDGRHPSSVTYSGPEQDALRRDFAVNGLFYDPIAGRLIDFVHGKNDIQSKVLRTIGDPCKRFAEDKLRMLRAVRLACELGFTIVPETWEAIQGLAAEILQVSWERIRDESLKLLAGPAPDRGLELLQQSGLLVHILPEITAMRGIPQSPEDPSCGDVFDHTRTTVAMLRRPSKVLALAALLHDSGKPSTYSVDRGECFRNHSAIGSRIAGEICRRLRMSNQETDEVSDLVLNHMEFLQLKEMPESALIRFLRRRNFANHLELFRANSLSSRHDLELYKLCRQKLEQYSEKPLPVPLITGEDLTAMGYQPGPIYREILRSVEDLQLEGRINTREEALEHVKLSYPL
jgi:poly(A) polymerase